MNTENTKESLPVIAKDIAKWTEEILDTNEFLDIVAQQNSRWKKVYPTNFPYLPAANLNFSKFTNLISKKLSERFGEKLAFIGQDKQGTIFRNDLQPMVNIMLLNGDNEGYNPNYWNKELPSFLPENAEAIIQEWMQTGSSVDEFIKKANNQFCIFYNNSNDLKLYIQLDLIFSALLLRMQNLPPAKKTKEDFLNSIYINSDFLVGELENILPFYACRKEYLETDLIHSEKTTLRIEYDDTNISDVNSLDDSYPLIGLERNEKDKWNNALLSKKLAEYLRTLAIIHKTNKILKAVYPLYAFYANNVLSVLVLNENCQPSRHRGCKLRNPKLNLDPIINFLKLHISPLKKLRIDENRKIKVATQLYALHKVDNYLQTQKYLNFRCKYRYTYGNNTNETHEECNIVGDASFTAWLYIRYSDLFHIALMPKIENVFENEESSVIPHLLIPKRFLTAFTFNENVFRYYPTFYREYEIFIESNAQRLFNKYKELSVNQWLEITRLAERCISQNIYGNIVKRIGGKYKFIDFSRHEIHSILKNFFNRIGWKEEINPMLLKKESFNTFEKFYYNLSSINSFSYKLKEQ